VTPRILKFYAVGLAGIGIQLAMLGLLTGGFRMHYIISTALAVETAIIHNFFLHECWTWRDRTCTSNSRAIRFERFWKFNLSNGLISVLTNLVVTRAFVELVGVPLLIANVLAIGTGSAVTFLAGELIVFREQPCPRQS
jgi:putative flippase GtrA